MGMRCRAEVNEDRTRARSNEDVIRLDVVVKNWTGLSVVCVLMQSCESLKKLLCSSDKRLHIWPTTLAYFLPPTPLRNPVECDVISTVAPLVIGVHTY
jgi:hypothetical protein